MSVASADLSGIVLGMANPSKADKVRVTVDLSEDMHERFIAACFNGKPRRSMQEVLRELIERWLAEQKKAKR